MTTDEAVSEHVGGGSRVGGLRDNRQEIIVGSEKAQLRRRYTVYRHYHIPNWFAVALKTVRGLLLPWRNTWHAAVLPSSHTDNRHSSCQRKGESITVCMPAKNGSMSWVGSMPAVYVSIENCIVLVLLEKLVGEVDLELLMKKMFCPNWRLREPEFTQFGIIRLLYLIFFLIWSIFS